MTRDLSPKVGLPESSIPNVAPPDPTQPATEPGSTGTEPTSDPGDDLPTDFADMPVLTADDLPASIGEFTLQETGFVLSYVRGSQMVTPLAMGRTNPWSPSAWRPLLRVDAADAATSCRRRCAS
ncbi:hypothetical protein G7085_07615 [Tessaracoccus sp. HDW20]|uniref:hypothetical protein n=1 Tax=Tessaracoccus coleopterorum TaxID=2714950 RepID=UPI0018D30019|nr:hypothetical protein [Tessaracoccus coleopterorum]NHB84516.1 hypothetical protein [Tessaracoccus coleopterorum]